MQYYLEMNSNKYIHQVVMTWWINISHCCIPFNLENKRFGELHLPRNLWLGHCVGEGWWIIKPFYMTHSLIHRLKQNIVYNTKLDSVGSQVKFGFDLKVRWIFSFQTGISLVDPMEGWDVLSAPKTERGDSYNVSVFFTHICLEPDL